MPGEPRRRRSPQLNAVLRSDHADSERHAQEELNDPNVANEVLIEEARIGHAWYFIPCQRGRPA